MNTIALWGSNSSTSINKTLIQYVTNLTQHTEIVNLADYDLPLYSFDIEKSEGFSESLKSLAKKFETADKIIISVAEHNGNLSVFFKNYLDWLSRNNREFLKGKKIFLLSTAPGKFGGSNALNVAKNMLPHFGAEITTTYSISNFYDVFQDGKLVDEKIASELKKLAEEFMNS